MHLRNSKYGAGKIIMSNECVPYKTAWYNFHFTWNVAVLGADVLRVRQHLQTEQKPTSTTEWRETSLYSLQRPSSTETICHGDWLPHQENVFWALMLIANTTCKEMSLFWSNEVWKEICRNNVSSFMWMSSWILTSSSLIYVRLWATC